MTQFVDWELAAATAAALGRVGPTVTPAEASDVVRQLRVLAAEATEHVAAFTGLSSGSANAPVRVVDRRDWASVNVDGLRKVITPLLDEAAGARHGGPWVDRIGSRVAGVQAGTVLAYMSGRVLGQYEIFSGEPGQLLLVAPNIVDAQRRLGAKPRDFQLWVCLHEVTHRTQFTSVTWLRQHLLDEVAAYVKAGGGADQFAERARAALAAVARAVRDPQARISVLELIQTPQQRAVLDRLTALMTLLEGHAEYVMDGVGHAVVPSVASIRASFNRRREMANPVERLIRRLLGVDAKLRQYAQGRAFVEDVVSRVGMAGFNAVWQSARTLPLASELDDVAAWIKRVGAQAPVQ